MPKFNRNKNHIHRCNQCRMEIPCRAIGCRFPEWLDQCGDCAQGAEWQEIEGGIEKVRPVPARHPDV